MAVGQHGSRERESPRESLLSVRQANERLRLDKQHGSAKLRKSKRIYEGVAITSGCNKDHPFEFIDTAGTAQSIGLRCARVQLDEVGTNFTCTSRSLRFWVQVAGSSIFSIDSFSASYSLNSDLVTIGLPGRRLVSSWRGRSDALLIQFDPSPSFDDELIRQTVAACDNSSYVFIQDACLAHLLIALHAAVHSANDTDLGMATALKDAVLSRMRQMLPARLAAPQMVRPELNDAVALQRFILANIEARVRISEFATEHGIDVRRVTADYRRLTGCSPYQHLMNLRIEKAKDMLRESGMPISELAFCLGFYDQSQFTRIFKKMTGETPKIYRATRATDAFLSLSTAQRMHA